VHHPNSAQTETQEESVVLQTVLNSEWVEHSDFDSREPRKLVHRRFVVVEAHHQGHWRPADRFVESTFASVYINGSSWTLYWLESEWGLGWVVNLEVAVG
jgi:hypothetical protein